MEVKSTLKVINEADIKGRRGVTDGQSYQRLIGWPEVAETDRVRVGRATTSPARTSNCIGTRSKRVIT